MKKTRKLLPVEPYEISALESWLSDQSAEGLRLIDLNTFWGVFEQGEPHRLQYHMEPKDPSYNTEPPLSQKENYQEKGWHFLCSFSRFFYVFFAEEGALPLHEDPAEEGALYQSINGGRKTQLFNGFLLLVGFLLMLSDLLLFFQRDAYHLVTFPDVPLDNIFVFLIALLSYRRERGFQLLQADFFDRECLHKRADWDDPSLRRKHHLQYFVGLLTVLTLFLPWLPFCFSFSEKPLAELKHPVPMVSLAAIENDPNFYPIDTYIQKDFPSDTTGWERKAEHAFSSPTVGAPVDLSYNQAGRIAGKTDEQGNPYESVLWVDYRQLSSFVSPTDYLKEYFERESYREEAKPTLLTDTPFEYAVLVKTEELTELYLVQGQKILELSYYHGDADLTDYYDLYQQVLEQDYRV